MAAIVASSPRRDAHAPSLLARVKGSLARTGSPPSPEAVGFDRNASSSPTNQPSRRFRFSGRAPTSTSVPDLFSPDGKLEGPTSNGIKGLGSRTKSAGDATGKTRRKKTLRGRFGKVSKRRKDSARLSIVLPHEQDKGQGKGWNSGDSCGEVNLGGEFCERIESFVSAKEHSRSPHRLPMPHLPCRRFLRPYRSGYPQSRTPSMTRRPLLLPRNHINQRRQLPL